jgi:hypothetical protein
VSKWPWLCWDWARLPCVPSLRIHKGRHIYAITIVTGTPLPSQPSPWRLWLYEGKRMAGHHLAHMPRCTLGSQESCASRVGPRPNNGCHMSWSPTLGEQASPSTASHPLYFYTIHWVSNLIIRVSTFCDQGSGDFWAQPAKIRPFTTSTGFLRIILVANLLPLIWTGQYPIFFFKCRLLHCNDNQPRPWALISKPVFQCSKIMKCNNEAKTSHVRHSPTSLQRTNNLNPRTIWIKPDEIRLFYNSSGEKSCSSKWLPVEIRFSF